MSGRGEFDFIRTRLVPLTRQHAGARGLADDAAVLGCPPDQELVLACDTLVEQVHFLTDDTPQTVAARALGSNLSDLAAMGAEPVGYLMALTRACGAWPRPCWMCPTAWWPMLGMSRRPAGSGLSSTWPLCRFPRPWKPGWAGRMSVR